MVISRPDASVIVTVCDTDSESVVAVSRVVRVGEISSEGLQPAVKTVSNKPANKKNITLSFLFFIVLLYQFFIHIPFSKNTYEPNSIDIFMFLYLDIISNERQFILNSLVSFINIIES
jgi:hypothetical protein